MDEYRKQEEQEQEHHHDHEHRHDHHEGHEHHHDHDHHHQDEECGCGHHEHDHHHDHDHHHHDEECGCGHHEHDHHHDHDHHDHEHHHDHGHQYDVPGFRIFETHSHEGATICSFEKDSQKDSQTTAASMEQCIRELEQWLDATDAVIGHVKGYVKDSGPITTFSTVGCGLNIEHHEGSTVAVGFAAIVFGPEEEELKDKVAEIFAAV